MVYQWFDTSLCITLIPWTKAFVRHHLAFIGAGISGHWGKIQRDVVDCALSTGLFSLWDLDSRIIFPIMCDTLGVDFDFFGIGEFWGCRSQHKGRAERGDHYDDQDWKSTRFTHCQVCRVNFVAPLFLSLWWRLFCEFLNASLLSRIDGSLINVTTNPSEPIKIDNGSVLMDHQVRFTFEEEENSVVLISLQYESGNNWSSN